VGHGGINIEIMNTFTPGPWEATQEEAPVIQTFSKHPTGIIARVYRNDNRAKADAALMAAAPELLEALELHIAFLASLNPGWLGKTTGKVGLLNEAYCKGSVALAKAKGTP